MSLPLPFLLKAILSTNFNVSNCSHISFIDTNVTYVLCLVIFENLDLDKDGMITKENFMTIEKPLRLLNGLHELHVDDLPFVSNLEKIFDKLDTKKGIQFSLSPSLSSMLREFSKIVNYFTDFVYPLRG
jgi:hypothetical protein